LSGEGKLAISLEIESRLDQVRLVRAAMAGILDHMKVIEADILSLELAVTELVNNSVEHGYGGAEHEPIKVQIEVRGSVVRVEIIDHAKPFPEGERYRIIEDLGPLAEPDEDWSPRGHGLQIVRQIVDSLVLECGATQNVLTLSKNVGIRPD
jgi:anti-sigma regulatory factor (Ser/Thr protein kinase)